MNKIKTSMKVIDLITEKRTKEREARQEERLIASVRDMLAENGSAVQEAFNDIGYSITEVERGLIANFLLKNEHETDEEALITIGMIVARLVLENLKMQAEEEL